MISVHAILEDLATSIGLSPKDLARLFKKGNLLKVTDAFLAVPKGGGRNVTVSPGDEVTVLSFDPKRFEKLPGLKKGAVATLQVRKRRQKKPMTVMVLGDDILQSVRKVAGKFL